MSAQVWTRNIGAEECLKEGLDEALAPLFRPPEGGPCYLFCLQQGPVGLSGRKVCLEQPGVPV